MVLVMYVPWMKFVNGVAVITSPDHDSTAPGVCGIWICPPRGAKPKFHDCHTSTTERELPALDDTVPLPEIIGLEAADKPVTMKSVLKLEFLTQILLTTAFPVRTVADPLKTNLELPAPASVMFIIREAWADKLNNKNAIPNKHLWRFFTSILLLYLSLFAIEYRRIASIESAITDAIRWAYDFGCR